MTDQPAAPEPAIAHHIGLHPAMQRGQHGWLLRWREGRRGRTGYVDHGLRLNHWFAGREEAEAVRERMHEGMSFQVACQAVWAAIEEEGAAMGNSSARKADVEAIRKKVGEVAATAMQDVLQETRELRLEHRVLAKEMTRFSTELASAVEARAVDRKHLGARYDEIAERLENLSIRHHALRDDHGGLLARLGAQLHDGLVAFEDHATLQRMQTTLLNGCATVIESKAIRNDLQSTEACVRMVRELAVAAHRRLDQIERLTWGARVRFALTGRLPRTSALPAPPPMTVPATLGDAEAGVQARRIA